MEILWSVKLNDGTEIYSDYYIYGLESPWIRLQEYCNSNNKYIISVHVIMFGSEKITLMENENGLDGVFVHRGSSKEILINDECDTGVSYKHVVCGLLNNDTGIIHVKKFSWPENCIEPFIQERNLTKLNFDLMIFKNDERKREAGEKFQIS
jgi:hypothetical protein